MRDQTPVALTDEEAFVVYAALGRDLLRARRDGLAPSPAVVSAHDKLAHMHANPRADASEYPKAGG